MLVNFVVRNVKKMVPAFSLPNAVRFKHALAQARAHDAAAGDARNPTISPSCSTPAAPPASPKGPRCIAPQRDRQCAADAKPGCSRHRAGRRTSSRLVIVCALPLYHIFALTVCALLGTRRRRTERSDPEPARHSGLHQGTGKYKVNMLPAVNTLYNALLNNPDFAKLDFSSLQDAATAAAWRCSRPSPTDG